jgi:hypothetical protein
MAGKMADVITFVKAVITGSECVITIAVAKRRQTRQLTRQLTGRDRPGQPAGAAARGFHAASQCQ